jgi:G:T-mismatch repair DNA endonuclease (very short patch repair protein)
VSDTEFPPSTLTWKLVPGTISPRDEARTRHLQAKGWTVIRFWNSDVNANSEGVAEAILQRAAECLGGTDPQPLPSREGRKRRPRFH